MADRKVALGVVGLGYWGPNLVRNFSQVEDCRMAMVCDLREERLDRIKRSYPAVEATTSYQEMVRRPDIDAIAIATPVSSHYELARQAMESGKHILIEKPMCANVEDGEMLVRIARDSRRILMVDHTFTYTASVRKIKQFVSSGEIGEFYYFDSVRINLGLFQPDVNVVWDLAPHDISIAQYLIEDKPVSLSATGKDVNSSKVACMAYITIRYESGLIAHIHVSWLSPVKIRRIIIGGSKKMLVYDDVEPSEKVRVYDRGIEFDYNRENPLQPTYRLGDVYLPRLDQKEALLVEAEHFIDCILSGKKPQTDGEAGLAVVRVLRACDRSLEQGGKEVMVE